MYFDIIMLQLENVLEENYCILLQQAFVDNITLKPIV